MKREDKKLDGVLKSRLDTASCFAVALGVGIILGGCFLSIALRNPGGLPVSVDAAGRAKLVAYVAVGVGATVAILVPATLIAVRRFIEPN